MYDQIYTELWGVQQALQYSCAVSTAPGEPELGDEPTQLHRLADTIEAHLWWSQEEIEQATQALKQVEGVLIKKRSAVE